MSETTLESLLNDEEETVVSEESEPEEIQAEEETETAETESTGDNEGLPPEPEETKEETTDTGDSFSEREKAFLAKANDEKAKRQALEKELESQKAQPQEPDKIPDPVEDPEGYAKYLDNKNAANQWAMRVSISQEMMREKYADYDEKEATFIELIKENPALEGQLQASSNPAKFAYDMAIKHERMAQFDNFDSAVSAEVDKQVSAAREQIEAALRKEYDAKLKKADLPPSGAKGSLGSDDTIPGEESLTDILGN